MPFEATEAFACQLDRDDPLRSYRDLFHIPAEDGRECIYFAGNSLGLQPRSAAQFINEELEDWKNLGVAGHFRAKHRPWLHYHKLSKQYLADIMGAKPAEVVAMNSLTVNLHLMMATFYRPTAQRFKIIIEAGAFPSDRYAVESQVKWHGFDPEEAIVEIHPGEGEVLLSTEDIVRAINENALQTALLLFGGVQYYTGQLFDLRRITDAGHSAGVPVGFDLAHAAGNVPLQLHDSNVDFAVWCSYKYLNSGPGGAGGAFVHERYARNTGLPRLAGWWGHCESERFAMTKEFDPMYGVDGWQLSNVNVLSAAAHLAALTIFHKVGMAALSTKSRQLTGYLEYLIDGINHEAVRIITPRNPEERGCQLSIVVKGKGKSVFDALTKAGVVADWREPEVIRVAPVPLYNTFTDVYRFYTLFKKSLQA